MEQWADVLDVRIRNGVVEYNLKWTNPAHLPSWGGIDDPTEDEVVTQWFRSRALLYKSPDHWHVELDMLRTYDTITFMKAEDVPTLSGNTNTVVYDKDKIGTEDILKFGWALANLDSTHLMHHSVLVKNACGVRGYTLDEGENAKPGEHPAVFPRMCYSMLDAKKGYAVTQTHLPKHLWQLVHPAAQEESSNGVWVLHTHTYTHSRDVFTQGWPMMPLFVDVCVGEHQNFKEVDNLYTLSNLGSSGVAATTTASFMGELVHKFVYLDLCKRCNLHLTPTNRFAMAVRETKRQMKGVPLASRMTRVISRRLPVPAWTLYDRGQPSTVTIPGLYIGPSQSELRFPRCIPDQILRRGNEWMVCEYKTRYGEKPDTDSSNKSNAVSMVVQCVWQAVAFRLCTGHANVSAKAIEVAIRSNRIARAETRVLEWSSSAQALPAWFAWTLLCRMKRTDDKYTAKMWLQYNATHTYQMEIFGPELIVGTTDRRTKKAMLVQSCYVCRFIYSLVRGFAVTDRSDDTIHPIIARLFSKTLRIQDRRTKWKSTRNELSNTLHNKWFLLEFYIHELNLFGYGEKSEEALVYPKITSRATGT